MPGIPNLLKTITVMLLRLVTIIPMIYSLEHVLTVRPGQKPLLWCFRFLMLQSVLTALLPYLLQKPALEVLLSLRGILSATGYATLLLLFFCFKEPLLLQYFAYTLTTLVQNAVTVIPTAVLMLAGIQSDVTSASELSQLPRYLLTTALTAALVWGALYLSRKLIRRAADHRKFLMGSALFFIVTGIAGQFLEVPQSEPILPDTITTAAVFLLGTMAFAFAVLLSSFWYVHQKQAKLNLEAMEKTLQLQHDHYLELQKHNEVLHRLQHDHKNHLFVLDTLLRAQHYGEAAAYLQELQLHEAAAGPLNCGHPFVSAILQSKQAAAEKQGTQLDCQVILPPALTLSNVELVSIFSNLLDNALAACRTLPEGVPRTVCVQARIAAGLLVVTVTNSCAGKPIRFASSRRGHGLGLQIVRRIARENDGTFTIEQKGTSVEALFSIPCSADT